MHVLTSQFYDHCLDLFNYIVFIPELCWELTISNYLDFHVTFYLSNFIVNASHKLGQLRSGVALYTTSRLLKITISKS